MPLVRCMWYDEDGMPNPRHCPKGSNCSFVHPSAAEWNIAPPSRRAQPGQSRRDPRGGGPSRSFSHGGNQWNSPSSSSPTKPRPSDVGNGWNVPTEPPEKTQVENAWSASSQAENKPAWGSGSWSAPVDGKGQSTGGWGSESGWGAGDSGGAWTTSSTEPGWGPAQKSSSSAKSRTEAANPWAWPSATATIDTWGLPSDAGLAAQDKGKGKEKAREDVIMREPSPPRRRPSPPRQDRQQTQWKKPNLPPVRTDMRRSDLSRSQSPISPVATLKSISAAPLPTRTRQGSVRPSPAQESLQKRALELAATKAAHETGKIYPYDGSRASSPAPTGPKNYDGPKGRLSLFTDLITHMQDLVIAEIFLRRAETEDEQWKRYQASEIYAHASPLTRSNLDAHRQAYKDRVGSALKNRDAALRALLKLPDFAPRTKVKDHGVSKEVVASYAAELREWLMGLQLHKRLLAERRAREEAEALRQSAASVKDSPPLTAEELRQRRNWTWRELKAAVALLDQKVDAASEQVYSELCMRLPQLELDEKFEERVAELQLQLEESVPSIDNQSVENLRVAVAEAGENLRSKAEEAAKLFHKLQSLKAELDVITAEKNRLDGFCTQAEKQFQIFDESNKAQQARIEELTQQLQTLHLHKRTSLEPAKPATPPPAPVKIEDILEYIRPVVLQKIEADMVPFFNMMRQRVSENQDEVAKELEERVKPIVEMTDDICQKVMSMHVSQFPSQVPVAPMKQ